MAVVETRGLTKRFRRTVAVDGLDLVVEKGDLFGFLGPNGAGKSTTIRMLLALVRPTAGSALIFGKDVWKDKPGALRNVGALVETPSFYKFLTGRENLTTFAATGRGATRAQVERALETVGLADRADDKVSAYSHGMRQRLGIAQAVLGDPNLVILDEPTTGLDPEGMKEIRELVGDLRESMGTTALLSSHLLHEVEQICNKVAIINRGKIVAQGSVAEMLSGSSVLEIRVSRAAEAAEMLANTGWVKIESVEDGVIRLNGPADKSSELNRLLIERGFEVSALIPRNRTLEEVYLSVAERRG